MSDKEAWGMSALRELMGSKARAKVIAWVCSRPRGWFTGAELARELALPPTAVSRELARLERLGMLRVGRVGRAKPYHLDERFPLVAGLRSVVMYATGVIAALRDRLADERDVRVAFIFGSVAAGDDRPDSDVDLLVIGSISAVRLSQLVREAEQATGREVNQVLYSEAEFRARLADGTSFLHNVMRQPKVFIKGDQDALRGIAE